MRQFLILSLIVLLGWVCSGCQQFLQDYNYSPLGGSQMSSNAY
ncbi:MAG TPA: hypothetical protein PK997_04615 [Candidatus Omnitrophota bacterium]|jgi:hypothetical protein|nr:MAG: hypothetical protein BWY49_00947 [Candidatus Omnitrophica bacterium ADurb.Bin314]HOE68339.1 hypothetical protein [Candidatus Omnitrophota bacterium]HQB94477.1 hypothetical protein [Candidatus Omnitrophota bacterium]